MKESIGELLTPDGFMQIYLQNNSIMIRDKNHIMNTMRKANNVREAQDICLNIANKLNYALILRT